MKIKTTSWWREHGHKVFEWFAAALCLAVVVALVIHNSGFPI